MKPTFYCKTSQNKNAIMTKGYVYCISNPSFKENLYKIGFTTKNLQTRIDSLYKTGVPTKFQINLAKMVKNCRKTETDIHLKLKRMRVNPSREFFKCTLPKIKAIFENVGGTWCFDNAPVVVPIPMAIPKKNFNLRSGSRLPRHVEKNKVIKTRTKHFRKVKHLKINYRV